jgi:hypothetical protein
MDDQVKLWKCGNGHALGMVARNSSGVRNLLLYREAAPGPGMPGEDEMPEVMAVVVGYMAEVRCSVCGAIQSWLPEKLIRRKKS